MLLKTLFLFWLPNIQRISIVAETRRYFCFTKKCLKNIFKGREMVCVKYCQCWKMLKVSFEQFGARFPLSTSQCLKLLCNKTSCQLFWKINCLSWIPVKQSALILWRKGEQLCSSLLKSGLTSFISWAVIIWFYKKSLPCAKSSTWTQGASQLPGRLVGVFGYLFNHPALTFTKMLNTTEEQLHLESSFTVALSWPKPAQRQKDSSCSPISVWRQVFWKSKGHLEHGFTTT